MRDTNRRAAIAALFFCSGAVGLAYEVVWARQLSLFLGVSVYAISAVLVAFMGGLGLGAELFGRRLDRGLAPIRLYAALEITLGVYVLLFPFVLSGLGTVYALAHGGVEGVSFGVIALRFALAVAALFPPTVLMGGTLPALVRFFASERKKGHGGLAGWLYAVNTLGAMTGCLAAGFFMIETLGLTNTLRVGAAVNIMVGVTALLIAGERSWSVADAPRPPKTKRAAQKETKRTWDVTLLAVYGVSGFVALALELLWTRLLTLVLNNTTYAFSLILVVFLFGIGTGSALASRFVKKSPERSLYLFALFQIGVGVMALLSLVGLAVNRPMIGLISAAIGDEGWLAGAIPGGEPLASAIVFALVIVTPCALLMGGGFPLIVETVSSGGRAVALDVGRLYAVNIIGCVLGSVLAGFVMIPLVGIQNGVIAVAWLAVLTGCALLIVRLPNRRPVGVAIVIVFAIPLTGYLLYQSDIAYTLSAQKLDAGSEVEFYEEGPSATVLVSSQRTDISVGRKPVKRLWIDGDPIAGAFREALQLERLQAHIPLLFHPDPKDALVICFGTGSTTGAALTHGLDSVTAVDISHEVFRSAARFREGNLDVMDSPRLIVVEEDGRNFLLTTRRKFDFITSEPPPPSNAGIVSLYTREFYELARRRLKKGGVVSQWIPLHHLSAEDFKLLVASFVDVFPHAAMWYTKWDAIMIGSESEQRIDLALAEKRMRMPALAASLARLGISNSLQLAANYMMGPKKLRDYVAGVAPLTDDRPVVEFSAPRIHAQGVVIKGANLAALLENRAPPETLVASAQEREAYRRYFESQGVFLRGQIELNNGAIAAAAKLFARALELNENNPDARYAYLTLNVRTLYGALQGERADMGLRMLTDTEKMDTDHLFTPQLKFLRGMFLARLNRPREAEKELAEAIRMDDDYFLAIVNLAGLYNTKLNRADEAKRLYARALKLTATESERRSVYEAIKRLGL